MYQSIDVLKKQGKDWPSMPHLHAMALSEGFNTGAGKITMQGKRMDEMLRHYGKLKHDH